MNQLQDSDKPFREALQYLSFRYEMLVNGLGLLWEIENLREPGSLREAIQAVTNVLAQNPPGDNFSIMLLSDKPDLIEIKAAGGGSQRAGGFQLDANIWAGTRFLRGEGVAGVVLVSGEPVRINDVMQDKRFIPRERMGVEVGSLVCLPLHSRDEVFGVLNFSSPRPNAFTEDHERMLLLVARRIGALFGPLFALSRMAPPTLMQASAATAGKEATIEDRPRVLLVDDEEMVRNLGGAILRKLGYAPTIVNGGEEAIKTFETAPDGFDVVLLDLSMPKISGHQVLQHIRDLRPHQKIILSSGVGGLEDLDLPTPYRPDGYLSKPYLIATMAEQLRNCMERACAV